MRSLFPFALGCALALGACSGASTPAIQPSAPFTPELAQQFDDSVDYAENVEDLGGPQASSWRRQVDGLASNADAIAVVRIETVTSGNDAAGARTYRLTSAARSVIHGQIPPDHRVYLAVSEGEVGFNTVRGNEPRLQSRDYVLFARWYTDESGVVRAHWHLSPQSTALIQRIHDAIGFVDPNAPRETVIRRD